jgi:signal transduction histidine kinase
VIPPTSIRVRLYGALAIVLAAVSAMLTIDVVAAIAVSRSSEAALESSLSSASGTLSAVDIAEQMRSLRRKEVIIDGVAGMTTLLLMLQIGLGHLRSLERERQLSERNLALMVEKNQALETFAARAAHDLRAPLHPVRVFADLIVLAKEAPEEVRRKAIRIGDAVTRMARVIDDMLELASIGRLPPGEASVKEAFLDVLGELEPDLRAAQVSSSLGDHRVSCAPTVLGQIVRNLVSNAIKYRAPERTLRIDARSEAEGQFVTFELADNGVGMDSEAASHAFEPFYRGRSDVPGHGLGLSIVEGYVRAAGGTAEIASRPGSGTRIRLRLPRA